MSVPFVDLAVHYQARRALGLQPDDEVMTVPNIFIAIRPRTRVLLPAHWYGQRAEMDAIMPVAGRHGLKVVEDCTQAHGTRCRGRRVGPFGEQIATAAALHAAPRVPAPA